jgi:hypothetical protein
MHKISETSLYFSERYDAIDHIDLTVLQKCTAVVRQLAYHMATYIIDEYPKLAKSTAIECLEYYYADIIECFRAEFLRCPIVASNQHLLAKTEGHGFPDMLGDIEYMHWQ